MWWISNIQSGCFQNGAENGLHAFNVTFPIFSSAGIQGLPVQTDKKDDNTSFSRTAPRLLHDWVSIHRWGPRQIDQVLCICGSKRFRGWISIIAHYLRQDPVFECKWKIGIIHLLQCEIAVTRLSKKSLGTKPESCECLPTLSMVRPTLPSKPNLFPDRLEDWWNGREARLTTFKTLGTVEAIAILFEILTVPLVADHSFFWPQHSSY